MSISAKLPAGFWSAMAANPPHANMARGQARIRPVSVAQHTKEGGENCIPCHGDTHTQSEFLSEIVGG